jgi:hypothetical protein
MTTQQELMKKGTMEIYIQPLSYPDPEYSSNKRICWYHPVAVGAEKGFSPQAQNIMAQIYASYQLSHYFKFEKFSEKTCKKKGFYDALDELLNAGFLEKPAIVADAPGCDLWVSFWKLSPTTWKNIKKSTTWSSVCRGIETAQPLPWPPQAFTHFDTPDTASGEN